MAYTLEDYKAARDAFAGRVKMSKQDGDISDGFRRRDDRIALEALEQMVKARSDPFPERCPICFAEVIIPDQKFCGCCGRAL